MSGMLLPAKHIFVNAAAPESRRVDPVAEGPR